MRNTRIHYLTTVKELYNNINGTLDFFVADIGKRGIISEIGKYLKEKNPNIKVIVIEPETSSVLSKGVSGPYKIQGFAAEFIPATLDTNIYNDILSISNEKALEI